MVKSYVQDHFEANICNVESLANRDELMHL